MSRLLEVLKVIAGVKPSVKEKRRRVAVTVRSRCWVPHGSATAMAAGSAGESIVLRFISGGVTVCLTL